MDNDKEELSATLRGSLLEFTKVFFKLVTGREFIVSNPFGRESHHITIFRALTQAHRLEIPNHRLLINVPPGFGKSVSVSMWIAWAMTHNPDSQFLYISYSKLLSVKHTEFIKRIMSNRYYNYLFDVKIREDSRAKDLFKTEQGGTIGAYGSASSITGQDAGLPGLDRFSGSIIIDDPHKPDDVHSDTVRTGVIDNYRETIQQRIRSDRVPIIFIGQRLHEDDLANYLITSQDGYEWHKIILKAIDNAGFALYPEVCNVDMMRIKSERDPYVYASQYQQEPVPAGGSLFKPHWFTDLDEEPKFITTFITADTAETSSSYNDATVFSFFGLYQIENFGVGTQQLGLHWIDCVEMRIEPKDLHSAFMDFYAETTLHKVPPRMAAIEKKSTGVTLVSTLKDIRGISIREIERTRASGSKTQRFLEIQPYIASKSVSFTYGAKHKQLCVNHMSKITANDTHRFDDICDTLADAIKLALIEKTLYAFDYRHDTRAQIMSKLNEKLNQKIQTGIIRSAGNSPET
jgi:predicted phage terminase large subunit-like protein